MRQWFKEKWAKFKHWVLGILAAIGLVAVPIAVSAPVEYTYTPASSYEDDTVMPIEEIAETRLYCSNDGSTNYVLVASEAGADGNFSVDLAPGTWTCVGTHVATNSIESRFSEPVTRVVLPNVPPNPPVLNQ